MTTGTDVRLQSLRMDIEQTLKIENIKITEPLKTIIY